MARMWGLLTALQLVITPAIVCGQDAFSGEAREAASLRVDVHTLAEKCRHLTGLVEKLKSENIELSRQLQAANRRVDAVGGRTRQAEARIADLEQALARETETRKEADKRTIQAVAEEIGRMMERAGPQAPPTDQDQPPDGIDSYTVVRGDTLTAIAQAFGVPLAALRKENGLSGDLIREGQILNVPLPVQKPEETANKKPDNLSTPHQ